MIQIDNKIRLLIVRVSERLAHRALGVVGVNFFLVIIEVINNPVIQVSPVKGMALFTSAIPANCGRGNSRSLGLPEWKA